MTSVKPTIVVDGSVAAVTMAIAAVPMRGVMPATPAIIPLPIDPETSSASSMRLFAGSTFPKLR